MFPNDRPRRINTSLMVSDGQAVSRERLGALPDPEILGSRHKPIPHAELVDTLDGGLRRLGVEIDDEVFVLSRGDRRIYGVFALSLPEDGHAMVDGLHLPEGQGLSLAFIGDNTKQISLRIYGGQITYVCENMLVGGRFSETRRKHTTGLSLREHVDDLLGNFLDCQGDINRKIAIAQQAVISDDDARILICKAIEENVIPGSAASKVCRSFFREADPETEGRTLWALYGSFTRALRECPMATRIERAEKLNNHLFGPCGEPVGTEPPVDAVDHDDLDDDIPF